MFRSYYPNRAGINWGYLGGTWGYQTWYQWCPENNILFVISVNVGMAYHGKQAKSTGYEVVHEFAPDLYHQIHYTINNKGKTLIKQTYKYVIIR